MAKRALLTGCNYPGSKHALKGCINDVLAVQDMLTTVYDFDPSDISVMIDTDDNYEQPTGGNIKRKLSELVAASQPGDVLVFHYSGHGTQVPSDLEEADAKDEALCPTDMNTITDDDLRVILMKLPDGVKFTMIADCCHSGTLLDQPTVCISGPKSDDPDPPAQLVDTFTAAAGDPDNREAGNRALPSGDFLSALSERLGTDIPVGQIRTAMATAFGEDASAKFKGIIDAVSSQLQGGGGGGERGLFGDLLGAAFQVVTAELIPPAGAKPSPEGCLPPGKGILITGCQAHETSADACPSGDPALAYGALTNALTTVIKQFKEAYPDRNISYRTLVANVRDNLDKAKFAQNPCLECNEESADSPFILA